MISIGKYCQLSSFNDNMDGTTCISQRDDYSSTWNDDVLIHTHKHVYWDKMDNYCLHWNNPGKLYEIDIIMISS